MGLNKRYYSLDVLKFFLAIIIALHHLQQLTSIGTDYFCFYGGVINFGYCTEFFFIISGFVAALSVEDIRKTKLYEYVLKKMKKIYPMTALSMVVMLFIYIAYYCINGVWLAGLVPDIYKVLNSFTLTFAGGSVISGRSLNSPLWYVCVLLLCHILLWIFVKTSKENKETFIYYVLIMCIIGVGIFTYKINLPFANEAASRGYSAFFLGIILFYMYNTLNKKKLTKLSYDILFVCTILAIYDYPSFYSHQWGALTFVVFPCILFIALSLEKYFNQSFRTLGGTSFEIYIWHMVLISSLQLLMSFENVNDIILKTDSLVVMIVYLVAVIFICYLIHIKLENKITIAVNKYLKSFINYNDDL